MAYGASNVVPLRRPGQTALDDEETQPKRPISALRKEFIRCVSDKADENNESAEAERYFHGAQWEAKELKTLEDRFQPVVTFNRIKRKINTITGIIERLRQDPKAYPRNPQKAAEDGAEVATKVLNYALGWNWQDLATRVARRCAVRGLSGVECVLVQGDQGDPEIEWDEVDQRDFFYGYSVRADFSDCRVMGTTKWLALDEAKETWPDYAEELDSYMDNAPVQDVERGDERGSMTWLNRRDKEVRIVDHWYMVGKKWYYTIYCGETVLEWGESPYVDEKKRSTSKFEMYSNEVDHDGDRYGFFRDWKSPQDEINQRRSKSLFASNARRAIADAGAVDDVEIARREAARPDGWIIKNPGKEILFEDAQQAAVYKANMEMLAEAKAEIDTYGPNPGLIGTDIPAESGRAIQLLQAAGIAELGDFMMNYKNWKLRVYRKTWCSVQQFWQAPRFIRVTDDPELTQFVQVNGWQKDENGYPVVINQLSALDVDIIIDESADTINTMADTFDMLLALAKTGAQVPPEMIVEMSALPASVKTRIMQTLEQQGQNPMQMGAIQLKLTQVQEEINNLKADTRLKGAQAEKALADAAKQPPVQVDTPADLAKANLDVAKTHEIEHKIAVGSHVPETRQPPPEEPGLFDVNQAKARREHAQANAAEAQTLKTLREARTIDEAPPGMLEAPPPRPVTPGGP